MASIAKTVVATGASSGIGFEAIKQLLTQQQPYRFILGARDVASTQAAYSKVDFDKSQHSVAVLPLELSDLKGVKTFAGQVLEKLGQAEKVDYLMLNAARNHGAEEPGPGPNGSKWCESYIVNHLSQHYLVHLLRDKLVASNSRIVFVSSGAIRMVKDPGTLETTLKAGSGATGHVVYPASKLAALLGTHWWRRQLAGLCTVVAVSPGLIPGTGLSRGANFTLPPELLKDAKSVPEGGANVLRAFTRDDFPDDPDRIFLTSWGEWWGREEISVSLDKELQDKWSPGREDIEREEGVMGA
ncbi:WW domain-containing oxidoreductase [Mycena venus]|uniref:WW domain-containing oxidoreductase n=1 Tax=Mycena venus TaxID=2733690 RepID=A0A8H6YBL5_9AGAR|nr:WW domain-containing oxidoreductase [Mycena venus]